MKGEFFASEQGVPCLGEIGSCANQNTEGSIRISAIPEKNQAMLFNASGAVQECVESFPERFRESYLLEMQEFLDCALTGRKLGVSVEDGTKATAIGYATTEAWKTGKLVKI